MEITEKNYMFSDTYNLEEEEIRRLIESELDKLNLEDNYNLKINVVKNKKGINLGYSYIWTDDTRIYNALIGNNLDGSKREKRVEIDSDKIIELVLGGKSWGEIALEDEGKVIFEKLPPLVIFSSN